VRRGRALNRDEQAGTASRTPDTHPISYSSSLPPSHFPRASGLIVSALRLDDSRRLRLQITAPPTATKWMRGENSIEKRPTNPGTGFVFDFSKTDRSRYEQFAQFFSTSITHIRERARVAAMVALVDRFESFRYSVRRFRENGLRELWPRRDRRERCRGSPKFRAVETIPLVSLCRSQPRRAREASEVTRR